jgi:hypothetical protein
MTDGLHERPVYGATNYLRVEVKNRGTGLCQNAKLRLYWSVNMTTQIWPTDFVNAGIYGNEIPTNGGYDLPDIAPGETKAVYVDWSSSVPNPDWYGVDVKHVCIYARIVEGEIGLIAGQGSVYTQNSQTVELQNTLHSILYNAHNYNGIVWKNMDVYETKKAAIINNEIEKIGALYVKTGPIDFNPVTGDPIYPDHSDIVVTVGPEPDGDGTTNPINPILTMQDPTFFDKVELYVRPLGNFEEVFEEAINEEENYETTSDGWYKITSDNFAFSNLELMPGIRYAI